MNKQKRYYTVKEAAQILGVSTNTIYKYLDEGSLKGRRLNSQGRFKIPFSEIAPYTGEKENVDIAENPQPVRSGGLGVWEIAMGILLGMALVGFLPGNNEGITAETSLVKDIAVATWDYSARTSVEVGNLAQAGGSNLVAAGERVSGLIAAKLPSRRSVDTSQAVPEKEVNSDNFVLISVPGDTVINLREEPSLSSQVIAKIMTSEVAEKTGQEGDWTKVAIAEYPAGWVSSSYVETSAEAVNQVLGAGSEEMSGKKVVITETPTGWLRVRAAPGGDEIGKVNPGDMFDLLDQTGDWYLIEIPTGQKGWVSSEYAQIQSED